MANIAQYGLPIPPPQQIFPGRRVSRLQGMLRRILAKPRPRTRFVIPNAPRSFSPIKPTIAPVGPSSTPKQYRPTVPNKQLPAYTTDARQVMVLIAAYAKRNLICIVRYRKKTENNVVVTRAIEPYSVRLRTLKNGSKVRYLYGYCVNGPTVGIHSFIIPNILSIQGTNQRYTPRWVVEF